MGISADGSFRSWITRAVVVLIGVCAAFGSERAWAGANEPDYYVRWAGFATGKSGPYIDTGVVFTKMPLAEIGVASLWCSDNDFLGTDTAQAGCYIIDLASSGLKYYYRYGSSTSVFNNDGSGPSSLNTTAFNDVVWGQQIYINGTLVGHSGNVTDSTFANNTKTCYFFKGRKLFEGTAKVSYLRLYNGTNRTELVRDFRPGVKDGVVGFYDVVGDRFYTNDGTGSFDCGPRLLDSDVVVVDSNSMKFGTPNPAYGEAHGFAAGEQRTLTAPAEPCTTNGYRATCTGWRLYRYDYDAAQFLAEPYLTGSGPTCAYTHPDPAECIKLEWVWEQDLAQAVTVKAGEWDDATVWSTGAVPTKDTDVVVDDDVHCSGDVFAKSLAVVGATLRFHAATSTSVAQAIPDAPGDGSFAFDVAGDVSLFGGSLALHGGRETPTITNLCLAVGGNLFLSGASRMCVAAAAYDGEDCSLTNLYNTATRLTVGGALTLSDTAILYTVCDQKVGSPVRIDCGSFTLGASAQVNADERGWHWLAGSVADERSPFKTIERSRYTFARGPGHDTSKTGGGYGGGGSNNGTATEPGFGATYGYAYAPYLPGSPSGGDSNYSLEYSRTEGQCRGGGVFWLVTAGTATVDGTISATAPKVNWQAASGGSVWIAANDFAFGADAKIDVSGGDAGSNTPTAAGGGGRLSLAKNVPEAVLAALARGERPDGYLYNDSQTLVSCDISGGTSTAGDPAEPGTATFITSSAASRVVTVAGSPVQATPVSPAYGDHSLTIGSSQDYVAALYGTDPTDATWRRRCLGYVISNETAQVGSGETTEVSITVGTETTTLTWLWGELEYETYLEVVGPGHLALHGEQYPTATNVFLKASETHVLTAVPSAGAEFLGWQGDCGGSDRLNPVLTLDAVRQQHVRAVFRATAPQGTRTWRTGVTGAFEDAANWEGGVAPGVGDGVVVTSGTCRVSSFVRCASLTVSDYGRVETALSRMTPGFESNELVVSGDVSISGSGALRMGVTDGSSDVRNTLDVGGGLVLSDTAVLEVTAGRRGGEFTWASGGGFVKVGRDFRMEDASVFRPNCAGYNGGTVVTTVGGRFDLASGATVDANGRGNGVFYTLGWNEGIGTGGDKGAAHGGYGEGHFDKTGIPYDWALAPQKPGQQNRDTSKYDMCRGGGYVRIVADSMSVAGTVTADGVACAGGNSSGGSIWLVAAQRIVFGPTAVLSAKGVWSEKYPYGSSGGPMGASGGGRISVCEWITPAYYAAFLADPTTLPGLGRKQVKDLSGAFLATHPAFAESVAPGKTTLSEEHWGTFRYLTGPTKNGLVVIFR